MRDNGKVTKSSHLPIILATLFAISALVFGGYAFISERVSVNLATKRFDEALERGDHASAIAHGQRALNLYQNEPDPDPQHLYQLRFNLAGAHHNEGNYGEAARLYQMILSPLGLQALTPLQRLNIEKVLANSLILSGDHTRGISIISSFLQLAGNAGHTDYKERNLAAGSETNKDQDNNIAPAYLETQYGNAVYEAGKIFASVLKPALGDYTLRGDTASQLATANQMVQLGAFYSLHQETLPAATGLLSAAYNVRLSHLPETSRELTQIALILGPIYMQSRRYVDAETIYLRAFHGQEEILGRDSPDFSLYLKNLVAVYNAQGRGTEANALAQHMRKIFLKSFGRLRYSRRENIPDSLVRPVTKTHAIPANYRPGDLVGVASYLIPVSTRNDPGHQLTQNNNQSDKDVISVSLARENIAGEGQVNMPVRLAQLMNLCSGSTKDEALSLASGFYAVDPLHPENDNHPSLAEHQLGLAIDINVNGRLMRQSDYSWLCMSENAWQFGFLLSYPLGNTYNGNSSIFEPWHWRYVGVETARLYREVGPISRPQEFLANVDCFRDAAIADAGSEVINQSSFTDHCLTANSSLKNPVKAPSLKPDSQIRLETQAALKAKRIAYTKGPEFDRKGRRQEAGILYANALSSLDQLYGSSKSNHALPLGLLSTVYEQQDMQVHSQALRDHMRAILHFQHKAQSNGENNREIQKIATSTSAAQTPAAALTSRYQASQLTDSAATPENVKTRNSFPVITRPVTQNFVLTSDYQPDDLVAANDHGIPVSKDPNLDEMKLRLAPDTSLTRGNYIQGSQDKDNLPMRLAELIQVCNEQSEGERISLRSGFRAFTTQRDLYRRLRHRGTVTPPGMSEHQTGLAADIDINGRFMREDDKTFSCFADNAHHFGFILSYPKGNSYLPSENTFEPWHWRYVGLETAQLYKKEGPVGKPQEFLAALDCYREQARAREIYALSTDKDYCLFEGEGRNFELQEKIPTPEELAENENSDEPILVKQEDPEAARLLNKIAQ